jgi:hypothetical protein
MVLAFDHFKAYLLNTQKLVIVFTDARALMWVGRNREYSIAAMVWSTNWPKYNWKFPMLCTQSLLK